MGLAGGAACAADAHWIEPTKLEILRHDVKMNHSGPPVKILHLSDLHASPTVSLEYLARAFEESARLHPDLICITGDFITNTRRDFNSYARILAALTAAAPVFACLGNHDGGYWSSHHHGYDDTRPVRALLKQSGIQLLHNESTIVSVRQQRLCLFGLGDFQAREFDPRLAFALPRPSDIPRIVLSHNPDTKEWLKAHPWDLMLSGHTHGGQIALPWFGPPYLPVHDKRYYAGLYRWNDRWLHITKGVGNILGLRFNCPPDISLLTLT